MRATAIIVLMLIGVFALRPAPAAEKAGNWMRVTETHIVDPNGALQTLDAMIVAKLLKSTGTVTINYCALENAPLPTMFQTTPTLTCTLINPQLEGAVFHSDYACHGDTHGRGKMTMTYDTAEHYTGESTYSPSEMMSLQWKSTFVGTWTGPKCVGR